MPLTTSILPPPKPQGTDSAAPDVFDDPELKSGAINIEKQPTRRLFVRDLRGSYGPVTFDDDCTSTTDVPAEVERELRSRFVEVTEIVSK